EGWLQVGELGLGLALSAVIGLEREIRQKSAGLRTHALVGVGAALFMLISKYGFSDVLRADKVVVDPSRVAAQIVTGIGFLGAGLIFVRRDSVRGLTTAASVWVTAAIGAAAGAGLPLLAVAATGAYLIVALAFQYVARRLPRSGTAVSLLNISYPDGRGILRQVLHVATDQGFAVDELTAASDGLENGTGREPVMADGRLVEVMLHVHGKGSVNDLAARLSELPGVRAVTSDDANVPVDD
ncbi:MAG TPA: MgtC/SapB family protein, partial [Trebonia sp.]|nr:MgtC/SapB family protein [Trebonia sp.]